MPTARSSSCSHHFVSSSNRALVTLFYNSRAVTLFFTMTYRRKYILHYKPAHTDIYRIDTGILTHIHVSCLAFTACTLTFSILCYSVLLCLFIHVFVMLINIHQINVMTFSGGTDCFLNHTGPLPHSCLTDLTVGRKRSVSISPLILGTHLGAWTQQMLRLI